MLLSYEALVSHSLLDATQESKQGHLHVDAGCCHSAAAVGCPSCHPGLPVYNVTNGCHSSCTSKFCLEVLAWNLKAEHEKKGSQRARSLEVQNSNCRELGGRCWLLGEEGGRQERSSLLCRSPSPPCMLRGSTASVCARDERSCFFP